MSISIFLSICILLLVAYIFDISASRTRIPTVILLLVLGWGVKQATNFIQFEIPDLTPILPVLGTIGLILIVLEGSLELEINKSKVNIITKSSVLAILPIAILSFGVSYFIDYYYHFPFKYVLGNIIPFAIISSAIAIPTATGLSKKDREFVIYESSLSDIIGVIFFNFVVLHDDFSAQTFGVFGLNLIMMFIITLISTAGLSLLLSHIKHHVKFVPIILLVMIIYFISKILHYPSLIFIMFLGLFLGNVNKVKSYHLLKFIKPVYLEKEINRFREIIIESAFLIRSLFFLVFGFLINTEELLNLETSFWAFGIVLMIYVVRIVFLFILKLPIFPMLFIAPRGLITILLFLSIPINQKIHLVNNSLIIQVIVITSITMMLGMFFTKREKKIIENVES